MKYLSLFTGIGGFELGIQQAYDNFPRHQLSQSETERQGVERRRNELHAGQESNAVCIGYSEIDKYATAIYQRHFPYERCTFCKEKEERTRQEDKEGLRIGEDTSHDERNERLGDGATKSQQHGLNGSNRQPDNCTCKHKPYGDITRIDADALPDFDFLCGGFPCQAFSIAGKRKGFDDTRGTLFFDIARILRAKQPRLFLLENVKGLLSHDNGQTFTTIIATLDELGYDLQWQVLNSKNHGVPQNRERVFIVGHLRGTPRPKVFPFGQDGREDSGLSRHISNTLTARYEGAQATGTYIGEGEQHAQIRVPEATKQGYAVAGVGDSINLSVPDSKTRRGRVGGGIAQTLDTGMQQHTLTPDMRIRRLTPVECERLQGFQDRWTEYGGYKKAGDVISKNPEHGEAFEKISDTQRYKTLGNAVSCPVIRDIVSLLLA